MLQGGCHHATYDELDEHLHRVSARDEGAAAGPRPGASAIEMQAINPGVIPPQPVRPEARNPPGQPLGRWGRREGLGGARRARSEPNAQQGQSPRPRMVPSEKGPPNANFSSPLGIPGG
jgi:hypothetical protein